MDLKVTSVEVRDDGVATVWFDRPDRANSWTKRMNVEYRYLMHTLDADPRVRVIVVTGRGRYFSVGADTKALDHYVQTHENYSASLLSPEMTNPGHGVREDFDHDMVWHWGMRTPVVAALNGSCAGMAAVIASYCDFRLAASGVKFTTSASKLGLPAEYGLSWVLPRIVGTTHAMDILMTGRVIMSEELMQMGYLNGLFPADEFEAEVTDFARKLATTVSPASAYAVKRQMYGELLDHRVGASVEHSKVLINEMMGQPDYAEGVAALMEKRQPTFRDLSETANS